MPGGSKRHEFGEAAERLVELGWAFRAPKPDGDGTFIAPWMPPEIEQRLADELLAVFEKVDQGVWLMLSYLDLAVFDENYVDYARPTWLIDYFGEDGYTLHRWYEDLSVAFVFQPLEGDPKKVMRDWTVAQKHWPIVKDYIAAGVCAQNEVLLIKIGPEDLSYDGIATKIKPFLPVKPMKKGGPIEETMTELTNRYLRTLRKNARSVIARPKDERDCFTKGPQ